MPRAIDLRPIGMLQSNIANEPKWVFNVSWNSQKIPNNWPAGSHSWVSEDLAIYWRQTGGDADA